MYVYKVCKCIQVMRKLGGSACEGVICCTRLAGVISHSATQHAEFYESINLSSFINLCPIQKPLCSGPAASLQTHPFMAAWKARLIGNPALQSLHRFNWWNGTIQTRPQGWLCSSSSSLLAFKMDAAVIQVVIIVVWSDALSRMRFAKTMICWSGG